MSVTNETKYCYLSAVDTGDGLRVVRTDSAVSVCAGNLVNLETGESGIVTSSIFVREGDSTYAFISGLTPIYEATSIYNRYWAKEEVNESA